MGFDYTAPVNGGLYTGEPFEKGAPWANIPIKPDVDFLVNKAWAGVAPPDALMQYPGATRPGNNYQQMPGVMAVGGVACNSGQCRGSSASTRFFKYSYLA